MKTCRSRDHFKKCHFIRFSIYFKTILKEIIVTIINYNVVKTNMVFIRIILSEGLKAKIIGYTSITQI